MSLRVLIAPDKFKGTLTAAQAAEAIAAGWRQARPDDQLELFPISDGGDGFGEALGARLSAQEQTVATVDAAHRPRQAKWWWQPHYKTAVIESAQAVGLALLPPGQFHPFELDTFGLGAVMRAAAEKHPHVCFVGVGGSATNDGGFGLARALGWQFITRSGQPIERWTQLGDLGLIVRPPQRLAFRRLRIAVDVRTRLLGVGGATRIFGPQKGIGPDDVKPAERCLRRLARVVSEQMSFGFDPSKLPGSGAAGGLGFGLSVFIGGWLEPGFSLFAGQTALKQHVREAELIITGEGRIDETSVLMGKGVGWLARWAARRRKPCLGLAGALGGTDVTRKYFSELLGIAPALAAPEAAMAEAGRWLQELARQAATAWPAFARPARRKSEIQAALRAKWAAGRREG
jgi:glycerate kinase